MHLNAKRHNKPRIALFLRTESKYLPLLLLDLISTILYKEISATFIISVLLWVRIWNLTLTVICCWGCSWADAGVFLYIYTHTHLNGFGCLLQMEPRVRRVSPRQQMSWKTPKYAAVLRWAPNISNKWQLVSKYIQPDWGCMILGEHAVCHKRVECCNDDMTYYKYKNTDYSHSHNMVKMNK